MPVFADRSANRGIWGSAADIRRLAVVMPRFGIGGQPLMRLNMIHVWAKQGLALDLVVARADPAMIDALPESVRIFEIARRSPLLFPWALARYFLKHRPSHVLAAGYDAVAACVLLLRIVERRVPLVISIHSHTSVALRGKSGIWARVKDRVVYSALRGGRLRARGIIAVSEGVANDLVKIIGELPCNKLYTVPNPVVTQTTYALSQAPLDPALDTGGRPWIVFVGRLVPEKGVARLLEAYAGIAARSGVDLVDFNIANLVDLRTFRTPLQTNTPNVSESVTRHRKKHPKNEENLFKKKSGIQNPGLSTVPKSKTSYGSKRKPSKKIPQSGDIGIKIFDFLGKTKENRNCNLGSNWCKFNRNHALGDGVHQ